MSAALPSRPAVIVVGSLHYDIVIDSPGRPRKGETVTGRSWSPKFGGKGGNQAIAASRQGVATAMVGAVGRDDFGAALLEGLDRAKVERSAVTVLNEVKSGMSVAIFDDEGDYGAVIVSGSNLGITRDQLRDDVLQNAKVLVLQNEIPEVINEAAARRARQHGVITILNAAPARPFETDLPDFVDILVVNAIEAEMFGGGTVDSLQDASRAAAALGQRFKTVIVTAGGDGVACYDKSDGVINLPSLPVTVASTHGAGDCFVGAFAARLAAADTLDGALNAANQEAARLVSTPERNRVL